MFFKCKTSGEAKKLFRRLAKYLHPDCGGEADLMNLLKEAYDQFNFFKEELEKTEEEDIPPSDGDYDFESSEGYVYKEDKRLSVIEKIYKYAETHESFNTSFTNSVVESLEENERITQRQYNALVRVYDSFRMWEDEENLD